MSNSNNDSIAKPDKSRRRKPKTLKITSVVILLAAVLILGSVMIVGGGSSASLDGETWRVRQGRLELAVNESGTLQAERTERIRSRVSQTVTIIELVAEGIRITPEDVRNGKVLARLDSAGLSERLNRQEISYENASASLIRATENLASQEKKNESDIRRAILNLKFALLELEQYLGKDLADKIDENTIYSDLAKSPLLGGSAHQRRIDLETSVRIASEEFERAKDKLEWTERLFERDYVTRNELQADQLAMERTRAQVEQADLALSLFLQYDLPKNAEARFADWLDRKLELERVHSEALSQLAQMQANLRNAKATYDLESRQLQELKDQIEYCVIRAERPGLLMYASSANAWARSRSPIEEGASVRERQEIFHLPDISSMVADLKVHESMVTKVRPGQRATISVDAYPGLHLTGTVKNVASMPDPQHWTQDSNVYTVIVNIENPPDYLLPGMTCRAQVVTSEIEDAVYIPVHAITTRGQSRMVFVKTDRGMVTRDVEVGESDDKFVHIVSGLSAGEQVLLNPPIHIEDGDDEAEAVAPMPIDLEMPEPAPQMPSEGVTPADGSGGQRGGGRGTGTGRPQ